MRCIKARIENEFALEAARHRAYMQHLVSTISPMLPAAMLSGRAQQMLECLSAAQSLIGLSDTSASDAASGARRPPSSSSSAQPARRGVLAITGHTGSGKTSFAVRPN